MYGLIKILKFSLAFVFGTYFTYALFLSNSVECLKFIIIAMIIILSIYGLHSISKNSLNTLERLWLNQKFQTILIFALYFLLGVFSYLLFHYFLTYLLNPPDWLNQLVKSPWRDFAPMLSAVGFFINSLISSVALIVGGIWTYDKFFKKGEFKTRAYIKHVVHLVFADNNLCLVCEIVVTNVGERRLIVKEVTLDIYSLIKSDNDSKELCWEKVCNTQSQKKDLIIEPKESDSIVFDIMDIPMDVIKNLKLISKIFEDSKENEVSSDEEDKRFYRLGISVHDFADKYSSKK